MNRSGQVRVAVADQHALFTECLGVVLEMRKYHYRVVPIPPGAGQNSRLLSQFLATRPDVVLINADLGPDRSGVGLIEPLVRAGVAVVVITENLDEACWGQCLAHGARTVISKSASLASVISVVRRVTQGEPVLAPVERGRLIDIYRRQSAKISENRGRLERLSAQEGEILRHLMAGRTVREIAVFRVVSEGTVRTQVKSVLGKLGLSSQLAAVAAAYDAGWAA
jgi:two-component system nitrate/nitrite response regulator NarL